LTATPTPLQFTDSLLYIQGNPLLASRGQNLRFILNLSRPTEVCLKIYSLNGRQVEKLIDRSMSSGQHELVWNARGIGSGTYIVYLEAEGRRIKRKIVIIR
jgi:hypothetical protein